MKYFYSILKALTFSLFVFSIQIQTFANVTVTPAPSGASLHSDAYTTIGNIVITEGATGDLPIQVNKTLKLTAPTGYEFNPGVGSVTYTASRNISAASIAITASTITVTFTTTGTNKTDAITISGIQAKASNSSPIASNGNIYRTAGNPGNATVTGITNGVTNFGSLSQATVTVTAATGGGSLNAGVYVELTDMVITENNNADLPASMSGNQIILNPPTGYEFKNATGSAYYTAGKDITAITYTITPSAITVSISTDATANQLDVITISGIFVKASNNSTPVAASGNITKTAGTPDAIIPGIDNGSTSFGTLTQSNMLYLNSYAKVSSYSTVGGNTTFNLTSVNESGTGGNFQTVGAPFIIMQMQDDVIGANTGDNSSFGNLSSVSSCGLYEILYVSSYTTSGGLVTSITVSGTPDYIYHTGANSSVQIFTFPTFGSPDYTTTYPITAYPWDGDKGGVIAFHVAGTLTVAYDIDASRCGFRGAPGQHDAIAGSCDATTYRAASGTNFGDKGEGIYKNTNALYTSGKGHLLNAGGGGNSHNGGGGGGSNFKAGGDAGPGWSSGSSPGTGCSPSAGAVGGIALNGSISILRLFLGGGGGSSEGNNTTQLPDAGTGGGIIMIKATEIDVNSNINIISKGGSVTGTNYMGNPGNDGNSGGGAGGSIAFQVNTWNVSLGNLLTIEADGGNGGNVVYGDIHAGGGGGGLGTIVFSTAEPTLRISSHTRPGLGGENYTGGPRAGSGAGADRDGILIGSGPMPIQLLTFKANCKKDSIEFIWSTAVEINNNYFTLLRSTDLTNWEEFATINGAGNSNSILNYKYDIPNTDELTYYRLKQTDFDGKNETFDIIAVNCERKDYKVAAFPNPASNYVMFNFIKMPSSLSEVTISFYNSSGMIVNRQIISSEDVPDLYKVNLDNFSNGLYFMQVRVGQEVIYSDKLLIE